MLDAHTYLCVDGARVTQIWLKPCLMYMCLFMCGWGRGHTGLATTLLGIHVFLCWWGRGHTGLVTTLLGVHAYLCVGGAGVTQV